MVPRRGIFARIKAAVQSVAAHLWPQARIGTSPSARPMWHDPAEHARDFAERYAQPMDSIIAHEYEEHRHGMNHEAALKHAPKTKLPISEKAREICRAMEKGWKR